MGQPAVPVDSVDVWRAQITAMVLRVLVVAGALVGVPSIVYALTTGQHAIAAADTGALVLLTGLLVLPQLGTRVRAIGVLVIAYGLGLVLLSSVGLVSHVYLLAVPVLAAVLLGFRAAVIALGINGVTLLVAGLLGFGDDALQLPGISGFLEWSVIGLNLLFVAGVLAVSSAVLLQRLEGSLQDEQRATATLERQRRDLQAGNEELAHQIDQRQRAEAEASRLAAAVTRARDVIVVSDAEGRVTDVNEAAEELRLQLGRTAPWSTLQELGGDDRQREDLRAALTAGEPTAISLAYEVARDTLEFDARITPVIDGGELRGHVAVLRDVTRERRAEAQLRRAETLEALRVLASSTAHDLNNALGSILAVAESALGRAREEPLRADLTAIVGACDRARDIVGQLGTFGERTELGRTPVRVDAVVEATLPLLRAGVSHLGARIQADLAGGGWVVARSSELEQVLTNLVTNAAQASRGDPDALIRITVTDEPAPPAPVAAARAAGPVVRLAVTDQGPGIDPATLERIFEPFFTTKGPTDGTGLGLASVQGIVDSLGGWVDVRTAAGQGTTFDVWLPRATPATAPDDLAVTPAVSPSGRLLLVDDEELLRELVAQTLTRAGYEVTTAATGEEAIAGVRADPDRFDLVITDQVMPGLDGQVLARQVHEVRPELPVLLCSGHADTTGTPGPGGPSASLAKPYTLADLLGKVAALLDREPV